MGEKKDDSLHEKHILYTVHVQYWNKVRWKLILFCMKQKGNLDQWSMFIDHFWSFSLESNLRIYRNISAIQFGPFHTHPGSSHTGCWCRTVHNFSRDFLWNVTEDAERKKYTPVSNILSNFLLKSHYCIIFRLGNFLFRVHLLLRFILTVFIYMGALYKDCKGKCRTL